jgi:pimeloyl-ACP methyl ester carboxylesterase
MVDDMATVADAANLEGFALFGMSQGCAMSIRYAVEHPERVRCMILTGGYTRGALTRGSAEEEQLHDAAMTMIKRGWGSPNPTYRHFFTSAFIPDATLTQASSFDELQRVSTNPENAARIAEMNARIDITEVARKVAVPTLVMHCEGDRRIPFAEGRRMAGLIPGARFVTLSGDNHIPLEGTPAFDAFFEEFHAFMREHFD